MPRSPNKPNTHRRRRRGETVLSCRVGVGGVYWALSPVIMFTLLFYKISVTSESHAHPPVGSIHIDSHHCIAALVSPLLILRHPSSSPSFKSTSTQTQYVHVTPRLRSKSGERASHTLTSLLGIDFRKLSAKHIHKHVLRNFKKHFYLQSFTTVTELCNVCFSSLFSNREKIIRTDLSDR